MATQQENLARFQEISNRGLEGKLSPDMRSRFDEALRRGMISAQGTATKGRPIVPPTTEKEAVAASPRAQRSQRLKQQREALGGEDPRLTARLEEVPEIGRGGLLSGESGANIAAVAPAILTATNPREIADILTSSFPNVGVSQTPPTRDNPQGRLIAVNNKTNATVEINKPGASKFDVLQFLGIGSAFLPAGSLAAAGTQGVSQLAGRQIAQRVAQGGAASGATQSALEASQAASGGRFDPEEIAVASAFGGAAEAVLPLIGSIRGLSNRQVANEISVGVDNAARQISRERFNSSFSRVPEEIRAAMIDALAGESSTLRPILQDLKLSPEKLIGTVEDALKTAPKGADPEEVIRKSIFDELGISTLKSRIAQTGAQFQEEQQLRALGTQAGESIRGRVAEESVGFQNVLRSIIDDTGLPEDAGEAIKVALIAREKGLAVGERKAYKRLAKLPGEGLPIFTKPIQNAFENSSIFKRIERNDPSLHKKLQDTLVEFGVLRDDELIKKFDSPSQLKTLTVDVSEDFRQALNVFIDPTDKAATAASKQLIKIFDGQLSLLDDVLDTVTDLGEAGIKSKEKISAQKIARGIARRRRKEFNPKNTVGRLIQSKRGTFDVPLVESSGVIKELVSTSKKKPTAEAIERVVSSLEKSGEKGQLAIGNLQAATVMELLESATKGLSAKPKPGQISFNGINYRKSLSGIGERELQSIFKDRPEILETLKKLGVAAELTQPISDVMNNSQSGVIIKNFLLDKFRATPGLSEAARGAVEVSQRKAQERGALSAIRAEPDKLKKSLSVFFPKMSDVLSDIIKSGSQAEIQTGLISQQDKK